MDIGEFSWRFDTQYNNITSNQAPGITEAEKSVFLTKAQDELVKNYFLPQSNPKQAGFDDNQKRQADFSCLMKVDNCAKVTINPSDPQYIQIDSRSTVWTFPTDVFLAINESAKVGDTILQVIPLKYDEYLRLMSKPFKRPLKNQAWRLINTGTDNYIKVAEIVAGPNETVTSYTIRYIRRPKPIILGDLDGLTINGYTYSANPSTATQTNGECELDPMMHEEILQRAVELAKIAWTNTGQDNLQAVIQAGQRSE